MPAQNDVSTTKVGAAGMVVLPSENTQSPWIENLTSETDGSWRPRFGLRLLRDFDGDRICGLAAAYQAETSIQAHRVYVSTEASEIFEGTINTIGAAMAVTWPSGAGELPTSAWTGTLKSAVTAVGTPLDPTAEQRLVVFAWPGVSNFADPQVWRQDGTKLNDGDDIMGVPFCHGNTLCTILNSALRWSTYGDANTWPALNETILPPEMGRGIGGCYWQEEVSYLFGDAGLVLAQGSPLEDALRFRVLNAPPAAAGSGACITKARDRIFYLSPGPSIYQVGGGLQAVHAPIHSLLRTYGDVSNYQMFYDNLIDALCVAPYVSSGPNYTFLMEAASSKWLGVYSFADNTKSISKAAVCGPLTASDSTFSNAQPLTVLAVAVGDLLSFYDPTLYSDEVEDGVFSTFTCAMETAPEGKDFPHVLKKMLGIYVDGSGTWTVKIRRRIGSGAYTTDTLGIVAAPGWVYVSNSNSNAYQERIVRVEASSSSTLQLKSLTIKEMLLGG